MRKSSSVLDAELPFPPRLFRTKPFQPTIYAVNLRLLEVLALEPRAVVSAESPTFAGDLSARLKRLDSEARARLARCPFSLVDAGYQDENRWRRLRADFRGEREGGGRRRTEFSETARQMASQALVLGWFVMTQWRTAHRLLLGASDECADIVRTFDMPEVLDLGHLHPGCIRLRWDGRADLWDQLIRLAEKEPRKPLGSVAMRALQLFLGQITKPNRLLAV